jgi:hypothetical protein
MNNNNIIKRNKSHNHLNGKPCQAKNQSTASKIYAQKNAKRGVGTTSCDIYGHKKASYANQFSNAINAIL